MITGYNNIKYIIAKLYRDLEINSEVNELDIVSWVAESLLMIGSYGQYEEVSDCLEITNGKAKLPCGFHKLVSINYNNFPIHWASNTNANNYQCSGCQVPVCDNCEFTFYINDSYIITNINTETTVNLCMVYLSVPVDEEGYPLIPDDVYFNKAIAAYVTYMLDRQDWRKGKLSDKVFEESKIDWLFYVNSARGSANMPSLAQLERYKNIMNRLLPQTGMYDKNFVGLGSKEKRRLH